jgi:hypothetical protein
MEILRRQSGQAAPASSSSLGSRQGLWLTPEGMAGGKTSRGGNRKDELLLNGMVKQLWAARKGRTRSESDGAMGQPRPQERPRQRGAGIQGADADGGETADGEAEFSMGDPAYGTSVGLGVAELSGLSDQELAEIRHWMVASDNRTDELRLLGNGVVPACAERAFRVLFSELTAHNTTQTHPCK